MVQSGNMIAAGGDRQRRVVTIELNKMGTCDIVEEQRLTEINGKPNWIIKSSWPI